MARTRSYTANLQCLFLRYAFRVSLIDALVQERAPRDYSWVGDHRMMSWAEGYNRFRVSLCVLFAPCYAMHV